MTAGQTYRAYPEDNKYRGVDTPKRLKATWNSMSGRWWKQGVDDALGPEPVEEQRVSLSLESFLNERACIC